MKFVRFSLIQRLILCFQYAITDQRHALGFRSMILCSVELSPRHKDKEDPFILLEFHSDELFLLKHWQKALR